MKHFCVQQQSRSRVPASDRAVQQLRSPGFLPRCASTQKDELFGGLFGMLLGQKDPCSIWVCSRLGICLWWSCYKKWTCVTAFITRPVCSVSMKIPSDAHIFWSAFKSLIVHDALCQRGPKYNVLAHMTLSIEHVQEGFKTHDLKLSATGDYHALFSSLFCLVAMHAFINSCLISFFLVSLTLFFL